MMKQNKNNLNDLLLQIEQLNEKYQIKNFNEEIRNLFRLINLDEENIENMLHNPATGTHGINFSSDLTDQDKFMECLKQYKNLKKKYKYNSYIREGNALRKNFMNQRKNYIFNSTKFIKFTTTGKVSDLEKLSIEFAEQQFISKWVDKLLKRIYPNTLMVEYETLDGTVKSAELQHRKVILTEEYIEAPLIDRITGEYLFDSFLVHSFYNVNSESYEYIPVKFIINIRAKDNTMFFEEDAI